MAEKRKPEPENTCSYCLYFVPPPNSHQSGRGNCSLHKQWIESAARTTCGDMSNRRLAKGIYRLVQQTPGVWHYIRRSDVIRTRLFLVTGNARGEKRAQPAPRKKRMPDNS